MAEANEITDVTHREHEPVQTTLGASLYVLVHGTVQIVVPPSTSAPSRVPVVVPGCTVHGAVALRDVAHIVRAAGVAPGVRRVSSPPR